MIFKTILLVCIGFSVASPLSSHVEDLHELMAQVDNKIQSASSLALFHLRSMPLALSHFADEAHKTYIQDLTQGAQPYWVFIAEAERAAAERGENIDVCVERGHSQIYAVNNTFANAAYKNVYAELALGQKIIDDTYGPVRDEPTEKLQEMHARVNACHNDACALQLHGEISREGDEITSSISASLEKTEHYVYVEFHENIEAHIFNPEKYSEDMHRVIADVENCIRQH